MGEIEKYELNGQTFFKIDLRLKLPNGEPKRVRKRKIPSEAHAKLFVSKHRIDAFEGRFFDRKLEARITVSLCWVAWEPITKRDNASYRSDVCRARHLVRILGHHLAAKLSRSDVEMYRQKRFSETTFRGGPPSPASVDREVALLKRMVNYQVECNTLVKNPVAGVPMLNEPNTRDMVLKGTMLGRILEKSPPAFAPVIEFDHETGLRKTEVRFLRWEQIDLVQGCIRLGAKETKTDQARIVYMTSRAREILQQTPRQLHSPYVFINPDTGKPWSEHNKMFKKACERAGLKGIVFHDLRRSFVTNARRSGVPESVVMKLSGHRTRSVFARYNIVDEGDLKAAVDQIDDAKTRSEARTGIDRHV